MHVESTEQIFIFVIRDRAKISKVYTKHTNSYGYDIDSNGCTRQMYNMPYVEQLLSALHQSSQGSIKMDTNLRTNRNSVLLV